MAQIIPRVQGPQVQVQQGPVVRNTAQADDSGAQALARSIGQLGSVAGDYAQQQQAKADTTAVMAARARLSQWEGQVFNPANPDGIEKYRGQNSLAAADSLLPDLDKQLAEINKGLTTRQQSMFGGVSLNFRDSLQGRLNGHMDREYSAYQEREQKAALENIGQDAVSAGVQGDFGRQDQVLQEALGMNMARRQADGMGNELIKAEERGIVSTVRAQTIENMAASKPFEAQAYFERYADQMTPEDRARADRLLFPVVSDAAAEDDAKAILAGAAPAAYRDPGQRGRGPSPEVSKILDEEADAAGVPREYLYALAEQESGFNPAAVNSEKLDDGDQATGLFQYRATSAQDFDRSDARQSARAAAREFAARRQKGGDEYAVAAHFAGENGADAVVNRGRRQDNPKTARYIEQVMGRAARWRGGDASAAAQAPVAPPTESEAIERAQSIRDPRRRAAVVSKIRDTFQLSDMRKQEEERAASEAAYTAINQATNPNAPLREILGAQTYAWAERKGHLTSLENLRKNKVAGTFVQDDAPLVEDLERQALLQPEAFAKRNIVAMADRISTDSLKTLMAKQKEVNNPAKRADWATTQQRIDSGLRILGIDDSKLATGGGATKKNAPLRQQQAQFALAYREAERAFIQKQKKDPTPAEADVLLREVVKRVAGRGPDAEAAAIDQAKRLGRSGAIEGFGAALPAPDRQEIIADFKAANNGTEPTEAQIVRIASAYRIQQNQGKQ